jgi:hypothetical protein
MAVLLPSMVPGYGLRAQPASRGAACMLAI